MHGINAGPYSHSTCTVCFHIRARDHTKELDMMRVYSECRNLVSQQQLYQGKIEFKSSLADCVG